MVAPPPGVVTTGYLRRIATATVASMVGGPAWMIAKSEWRARWRSLAVIALVGWLGATATVAAFAASRRADTSFDRLLDATGTANATGFIEGPVDGSAFVRLGEIDGVEGGAAGSMFIVGPASGDLVAGGNVIGVSIRHPFGKSLSAVLTEGRLLDQSAVDEINVNEAFAEVTGLGAGDRFDLVSYTPEEVERAEETGETPETPGGPTIPVTIAGVGRGAEDVSDVSDPLIIVSAAFADRYQDEIGNLSTIVLLRIDERRFDEVQAAVSDVFPSLELERAEDFGARVRDGLAVQRIALLLFAAVAGAAGLLAVMQNVRRFVALTLAERDALRAIGASRRMEFTAAGLTLLPAAACTAFLSVAAAIVVAPLLVTGLARQAEPDPGPWIDPLVAVAGVLLVIAAFGATGAIAVALNRVESRDNTATFAATLGKRLHLRAEAATGVRFALDSGRASGGVPTRSAVIGAAVGVAAVVATLTLSASIDGLLERPEDWGATFDLLVEAPDGTDAATRLAEAAAEVDGVVAVAMNQYIDTDETVSSLTFGDRTIPQEFETIRPVKGVIPVSIVEGRAPIRASEIVVGERVLELLGAEIGDRVTAYAANTRVDRTIVGTLIAPGIDEIDKSAFLTPEGLDDITTDARSGAVLVDGGDTDPEVLAQRLAGAELEVRPIPAPSSIDNLDEIGSLPAFVASFLAVLSVVAGVSAMVLTIRRRRREIAVLRSLGFVRRQVIGAIGAQSATLTLLALVAGLPLGIVAGRTVYGLLGANVGFLVQTTVPPVGLAAVVAGALLAAVLATLAVAPSAVRPSPAATLRTE